MADRYDDAEVRFARMISVGGRSAVAWDRDVGNSSAIEQRPRMHTYGGKSLGVPKMTVFVGPRYGKNRSNQCFWWRSDPADPLRGRWVVWGHSD